jgi:hypothetical protein
MAEPDWAQSTWRKSRRSGSVHECVECAVLGQLVGLRDSKDQAGPFLVFAHAVWRDFIAGVKRGEFDR